MSRATGWLQNWAGCLLSDQTVPLQTRLLLDTEALTSEERPTLEFLQKLPERGPLKAGVAALLWAFLGDETNFVLHLDRTEMSPLKRSWLVIGAVYNFPLDTLKLLSRHVPIYMGLTAAVDTFNLEVLKYIASQWERQEEPQLTPEEDAQEMPFMFTHEILLAAVVKAMDHEKPELLRPLMPIWNPSHLAQPNDPRLAEMLCPATAEVLLEYNPDLAFKFLLRTTSHLDDDTRAYLLQNLKMPAQPLFILNHLNRGHLETGVEVLERLPMETSSPYPALSQDRLDRIRRQVYANIVTFTDHLRHTSRDDLLAKLELLIRLHVVPRMIERLAQGLPADA